MGTKGSSQTSLSEVVEKQLLQIPEVPRGKAEFWSGLALRRLRHKQDPRRPSARTREG